MGCGRSVPDDKFNTNEAVAKSLVECEKWGHSLLNEYNQPHRDTIKVVSKFPFEKSDENAGYDLRSAIDTVVQPRDQKLIPTATYVQMPKHMYGQIFGRSGLAYKNKIGVKAGVIDSSWRGVIGVILVNDSDIEFKIEYGDRIAQFVPLLIPEGHIQIVNNVDEFTQTERGSKGYGSSGIK